MTKIRPLLAALALLFAFAVPVTAAPLRDCSELELAPGVDASNCSLPGVVLFGLGDLSGIDFSRSDLSGAIAGCDPDIRPTSLASADLARVDLSDALLCDVNFNDADLYRADLSGSALEDASFRGADLRRADLSGISSNFTSFVDADLRGADLTDADISNSSFDGADLRGAIFDNTTCPDGTNSDDNGGTCIGHL